MTTITVCDPPMCCATGVCGAEADQRPVRFAADLDGFKTQGVAVRRISLSQAPMALIEEPQIAALMARSDGDALPVVMLDGRIVAEARYPRRDKLARLAGIDAARAPQAKSGCGCGPSSAQTAAATGAPTAKTCC